MDNLAKDVREAMRLGYGCHYGHYKADHPYTADQDAEPAGPAAPPKQCKECGEEFFPHRPDQTYCTEECRNRWNSREHAKRVRQNAPKLPIGPAVCPVCGGRFNRIRSSHRLCSMSCAAKWRNAQRRMKKRETSSEGES